MLTLPGYQILKEIHVGIKTIIYRGIQETDQKSVIIKFLKPEYVSLQETAKFKHEYEVTQNLNTPRIVKALDLITHQNRLAIVFEDFGGQSLKLYKNLGGISLKSFLLLAIQISEILEALRNSQIIHKDIKPSNIIIINPISEQVKLTDFAIASCLERENQTINNPNLLEGTLAYMSPEQTGRMNRSVDYRSDFYSVGVTFYEMLTGQLPFETTDPMEMVHCHIAKQPVTPKQVDPEIPEAVSLIVMKLLAKTAEERYQSALGLKADLENCLTQLTTTGQIENFLPGQQDKSSQFQIPQKLYGRQAEVATLLEAFERVSCGTSEMMLVAGYSGIGKSALVNEIHKPIVGVRGYFISGKFDQYKRNIPYASLIQALQSLMRQLLTESSQQLQTWKTKLLEAFGQNGQVIIDVIPEVELIVGSQPQVLQLGSAESQNRFNRVFKEFIHVFTQKEHPLVIFLDDLHWADSASLKLINLLISDPNSKYLLLIGAYRDNEVSATHPFILTLDEIKKTGAVVNHIYLKALEISDVNQLIADTLNLDIKRIQPLAKLVFEKTAGNSFFLTQLLNSLSQENLLTFDFNAGCWQWDIELIQSMRITENVVEFMVSNIQKLDMKTQNVLTLAACIGNRFDLSVLSVVNETSLSITANHLWEALQAGLIIPLSDNYKLPRLFDTEAEIDLSVDELVVEYKFLHDRVQQAAYALIPDSEKKEVHLKVGQLLLKNTHSDELEENIFEIVNHLNIGAELITHRSEKNELAQLNLTAGQKAKAATAYESALRYLKMGLGLLTQDSWELQYDLTLALYGETVEVEYLNTNFYQAEKCSDVVLQKAKTLLEKVKVYEIKIQFFLSQSKMQEAVDTALQVLKMLGVSLSQKPSKLIIFLEVIHTKLIIGRKQAEELAYLPEMTDPYKLAAMRILVSVTGAAYLASPALFMLVILKMVNLCIKYGNSSLSAFAYCEYGLILSGVLGEIDSGYRFGQLALRLLEQFKARELTSPVYMVFNFSIKHWKEHAKKIIEPVLEGIQIGLESGDLVYACATTGFYCNYIFLLGETLESVAQKQERSIDFLKNLKFNNAVIFAQIWRQIVLNLQDYSTDRCKLIGECFNELEALPILQISKDYTSIFCIYLTKLILSYLFKDYQQSYVNAKLAEKYMGSVVGMMNLAEYNFYFSLALLALYPTAKKRNKRQAWRQLIANQKKLKKWAFHAPTNYLHKYELVEAEKARVLGLELIAMEFYERAILGAREQGYIQEEALAYELAAEFYLAKGRQEIAQTYMRSAYSSYGRWGATAKVRDLEERYQQFISFVPREASPDLRSTRTNTSTTGNGSGLLDLTAVIKASQALASEIVLGKLLDRLMKIVMENAGAQTSCLLLVKDDYLVIEAIATVDQEQEVRQLSTPATQSLQLPISVINYVNITQENVVLNDASREETFAADPYIKKYQPKSLLCTPIIHQGKLIGLLYLENNLTTGAFTPERLEVLRVLSSQVAISLENALLYANLQQATESLKQANERLEDYSHTLEVKVEQRTLELQEKNRCLKEQATQLEKTLQELRQTQAQLIQTEKLSSLGQLVAGVAHEINNPVNFIYGNLAPASEYIQELLKLIKLYQQEYPHPTPRILAELETIELEFLSEDLAKLLDSMEVGAERIRQIVLSLRNFSRHDEAEMKPVDIHEGIDSTLLILQNSLKAHAGRSGIEVIKEYSALPRVECYASQLNQVFMNILNNAIDALATQPEPRRITICTEMKQVARDNSFLLSQGEEGEQEIDFLPLASAQSLSWVVIRIVDNGPGMTESVLEHLFEPFFTTKPVGSGTGLGLSISYQIVVEKHKGQLRCISALGQGAEFVIEIPIQQHNQLS